MVLSSYFAQMLHSSHTREVGMCPILHFLLFKELSQHFSLTTVGHKIADFIWTYSRALFVFELLACYPLRLWKYHCFSAISSKLRFSI